MVFAVCNRKKWMCMWVVGATCSGKVQYMMLPESIGAERSRIHPGFRRDYAGFCSGYIGFTTGQYRQRVSMLL